MIGISMYELWPVPPNSDRLQQLICLNLKLTASNVGPADWADKKVEGWKQKGKDHPFPGYSTFQILLYVRTICDQNILVSYLNFHPEWNEMLVEYRFFVHFWEKLGLFGPWKTKTRLDLILNLFWKLLTKIGNT